MAIKRGSLNALNAEPGAILMMTSFMGGYRLNATAASMRP